MLSKDALGSVDPEKETYSFHEECILKVVVQAGAAAQGRIKGSDFWLLAQISLVCDSHPNGRNGCGNSSHHLCISVRKEKNRYMPADCVHCHQKNNNFPGSPALFTSVDISLARMGDWVISSYMGI